MPTPILSAIVGFLSALIINILLARYYTRQKAISILRAVHYDVSQIGERLDGDSKNLEAGVKGLTGILSLLFTIPSDKIGEIEKLENPAIKTEFGTIKLKDTEFYYEHLSHNVYMENILGYFQKNWLKEIAQYAEYIGANVVHDIGYTEAVMKERTESRDKVFKLIDEIAEVISNDEANNYLELIYLSDKKLKVKLDKVIQEAHYLIKLNDEAKETIPKISISIEKVLKEKPYTILIPKKI